MAQPTQLIAEPKVVRTTIISRPIGMVEACIVSGICMRAVFVIERKVFCNYINSKSFSYLKYNSLSFNRNP